eukprot:2855859-Pleurochrysis_carterae.AAC.1
MESSTCTWYTGGRQSRLTEKSLLKPSKRARDFSTIERHNLEDRKTEKEYEIKLLHPSNPDSSPHPEYDTENRKGSQVESKDPSTWGRNSGTQLPPSQLTLQLFLTISNSAIAHDYTCDGY